MPDQLALEQYDCATTRVLFACFPWRSSYHSSFNATTLDWRTSRSVVEREDHTLETRQVIDGYCIRRATLLILVRFV